MMCDKEHKHPGANPFEYGFTKESITLYKQKEKSHQNINARFDLGFGWHHDLVSAGSAPTTRCGRYGSSRYAMSASVSFTSNVPAASSR